MEATTTTTMAAMTTMVVSTTTMVVMTTTVVTPTIVAKSTVVLKNKREGNDNLGFISSIITNVEGRKACKGGKETMIYLVGIFQCKIFISRDIPVRNIHQ